MDGEVVLRGGAVTEDALGTDVEAALDDVLLVNGPA